MPPRKPDADAGYYATLSQAVVNAGQGQAALAGRGRRGPGQRQRPGLRPSWATGTAMVASTAASAIAAAENLCASMGLYQAALPVGPDLPTISAQAVDAVMLSDYAAPAVDNRYAGILSNLFATRTAERVPIDGIEADSWSEQLSGSTISGDMVRMQASAGTSQTINGVVDYYNEITGQYVASIPRRARRARRRLPPRTRTRFLAAPTTAIRRPAKRCSTWTTICGRGMTWRR